MYPVKSTERAEAATLIVILPEVAVATTLSADVGTASSVHVVVEFQLPPVADMVLVAAEAMVGRNVKPTPIIVVIEKSNIL